MLASQQVISSMVLLSHTSFKLIPIIYLSSINRLVSLLNGVPCEMLNEVIYTPTHIHIHNTYTHNSCEYRSSKDHSHFYRGADKSLARPGRKARQGRARFQQNRDASCH